MDILTEKQTESRHRIHSRWLIGLKCKTLGFLEDNSGENPGDLGQGDISAVTAKTQPMQKIIDKLDLIKILNFCSVKDTVEGFLKSGLSSQRFYLRDRETERVRTRMSRGRGRGNGRLNPKQTPC